MLRPTREELLELERKCTIKSKRGYTSIYGQSGSKLRSLFKDDDFIEDPWCAISDGENLICINCSKGIKQTIHNIKESIEPVRKMTLRG
jgi:hypothetical protein